MEEQKNYEVIAQRQMQVINFDEFAMATNQLVKQVVLVQEVMHKVMREGEHYGVIPGTKKPSLLKPGAEKLGLTFRLYPTYEVQRSDLPGGHREYEIKCTLIHIPTGQIVGQGLGSCSTMEAKYRYRTGEVERTGKTVPKEYWKERDIKLIGGKGFATKKNPDTGQWEIVRQGERVEHNNPADYFNTVLKMSKKRAHVDAILTATAASDIFTQDVEDMAENAAVTKAPEPPQEPPKEEPKPESRAPEESPPQPATAGEEGMTEAQRKKLFAMMKEAGLKRAEQSAFYHFVLGAEIATKEWASGFIELFQQWLSVYHLLTGIEEKAEFLAFYHGVDAPDAESLQNLINTFDNQLELWQDSRRGEGERRPMK